MLPVVGRCRPRPVSNFLSGRVQGGFGGDVATASITVNTIPKILTAPPGLRTMRDMVLPSYFGGK
jgi:hypothetical protein